MSEVIPHIDTAAYQLDEFYLDLQEDGSKITLLDRSSPDYCPYPGLRPFRTSEFQLFKGREGQAEELLVRLRKTHFLAVIGSSGTGKSSLIRAGLIPQLYGGYLYEAGSRWNVAICRPGRDPIENLSIALSSLRSRSREKEKVLAEHANILPMLQKSVYGILEVKESLPSEKDGVRDNLLIIIDQFEELFRFERSNTDAANIEANFVNLLLKASLKLDSTVYVIITMRSEFLGECVKYRGLPEVINQGQYLVPQLDRIQIKEVIEGPLTLSGKTIDPGLTETLINEIEQTRLRENLDQLPILQHALMRTYKWASVAGSKQMRMEDYEAIGGMQHALAQHAESKYSELRDGEVTAEKMSKKQQIAKIIFQALTDASSEQRGGRRPVRLGRLYAILEAIGASQPETDEVINSFRKLDTSFIMPPSNTALSPELIIDISHESLMRNWERLNEWMQEEVKQGELYEMLQERRVWAERDVENDNWIRGILLKELEDWRATPQHNEAWAVRYHKHTKPEEVPALYRKNIQFLANSEEENIKSEQKEKDLLKEKVQQEEKDKVKRRISRISWTGLVVAVILGAFAFVQMLKARSNQHMAEDKSEKYRISMYAIHLRDSADWWKDDLLTLANKDWLTLKLDSLYSGTKLHPRSHQDSLAGERIEQSMRMLKKAYEGQLNHWGNFLYLVREARDYDSSNLVTRSVLDSLLATTMPYVTRCPLDSADADEGYKIIRIPGPGAEFYVVNAEGIHRYRLNGDGRRTEQSFPAATKVLAVASHDFRVLTLQNGKLVIYEKDRISDAWRENDWLDKKIGKIPPGVIYKPYLPRLGARARYNPFKLRYTLVGTYRPVNEDTYPLAFFRSDGSQLGLYLGKLDFRLIDLSTGHISPVKIGDPVQQMLFSEKGHLALVSTKNTAWLIHTDSVQLNLTPLTRDSGDQRSMSSLLSSGNFTTDGHTIYYYEDSMRYAWDSKGQFLRRTKLSTNISWNYLLSNDSVLYGKAKPSGASDFKSYSTYNGPYFYMQKFDRPQPSRCFPWHGTYIEDLLLDADERIISGDRQAVYIWSRQPGHLTESEMNRYIDSPSLAQYFSGQVNSEFDPTDKDQLSTAFGLYKRSAQYHPLSENDLHKIGSAFLTLHLIDSAIHLYKQVLASDTTNNENIRYVGKAFYVGNRYDSALYYYSWALRKDTTTAVNWNDVGNIYYDLRKYSSAISYYQGAIRHNNYQATFLDNIAKAFGHLRQFKSAMAYARKAYEMDSSGEYQMTTLSMAHYNRDRYDSSLFYARKAIAKYNSADGWNIVGIVFEEDTHQFDSALAYYSKACKLDTTESVYLTNRAELYNRRFGNYTAALADAEKGIKLDSFYERGYTEKAYAYLKTNKLDSVYALLTKARDMDTADMRPNFYLACYFAMKHDNAKALQFLRRCRDLGLKSRYTLDHEDAFDAIRKDPEFLAFRAQLPKD